VTQSYVEDSMKEKLERIWTDKTPDHLDPDVKRYWRWLGLIIIMVANLSQAYAFPHPPALQLARTLSLTHIPQCGFT
jgi:hypothetical protein